MKADLDDAQIRALADRCVQCGLCLPHCPTYRAHQTEVESPRGRIVLIKALAAKPSESFSRAAQTSLDHCLGCRQCESACPADVPFDTLLVAGRARLAKSQRLPLRARALLWLLAHPAWLDRLFGLSRLWPGAAWWRAQRSPISAGWHRTSRSRRGAVGLFVGCLTRWLDAPIHAAAIRCLNRRGFDVWVPSGPLCCGSLHAHAGLPEQGVALQDWLRQRFGEQRSLDAVISCASGCTEALGEALRPQPVHELMGFLDRQIAYAPAGRDASASAAHLLHLPCTLRAGKAKPSAGQASLRRAGIDSLIELPAGCCGAGGWNSWLQPKHAERIFAPLRDWLRTQPAGPILSHNIGCRLHLQRLIGEQRAIAHPIEVLDQLERQAEHHA